MGPGSRRQSDPPYAHEHTQILVTSDKDFGELAIVNGQPHSGIIRRWYTVPHWGERRVDGHSLARIAEPTGLWKMCILVRALPPAPKIFLEIKHLEIARIQVVDEIVQILVKLPFERFILNRQI